MKRIKTILLTGVVGLVLVLASGCDLTEMNVDPNNPLDVPPDLMLAGLQSNFSYEVLGNTAVRIPAVWIHQLAYNGMPPNENTYDVTENDVNNLWEFWAYPDVLNNAITMDSLATLNGNYAYAGTAKIIEAWALAIMTDLYGSIPYSEAFDVSNTTPAYDSQEEIYNEIFELLDAAVADLQRDPATQPSVPNAQSDLVYGGDLSKWIKLAHSLKGRFQMRLSKAPGYSESEQAQKALDALENGLQSNDDDADFQYYATTGAENPWYQFAIDGKWNTAIQLDEYYVDLLKTLQDPRLQVQARQAGAIDGDGPVSGFEPAPFTNEMYDLDDPTYAGVDPSSDGETRTEVSSIGAFYSDPGAPLYWFNYASSLFTQAEAMLILQGPAAAEPYYVAGIRANMEKLGVPTAEIDAYLDLQGPLTDADARERILTQKYIANFVNVEAYNDWRRVGYPELEVVDHPTRRVDVIPLRFPYPNSELSRNAANIPSEVPTGYPALAVPVWWDTTVPQ